MKVYYKDKLLNSSLFVYSELTEKPSINTVILDGNKNPDDLNMYSIPQVDELLEANRAIKVVTALPAYPTANTTYYVGPTSEGNYHIWLFNAAKEKIDLGMAILPLYSGGTGISVTKSGPSAYNINAMVDNITMKVNADSELVAQALYAGEAVQIDVDSEGNQKISIKYDSETIVLNSEGELTADALPKPFIPDTFLHLNKDSELEWVTSKINGVELNVPHTTESVKITWYGTDSEYQAINPKYPYTIYINTDGQSDITVTSYEDLLDKPSINYVELAGSMSSSELSMYNIDEVDDLIASIKTVKQAPTLPVKADRIPNALYYIGTDIPYQVYLIDANLDEKYLGTSSVKTYEGVPPIKVDNENYISAAYDDDTIKLNTSNSLYLKEMSGASKRLTGKYGIAPAPKAKEQDNLLRSDATWAPLDPDGIIGGIELWGSDDTPDGWLRCNGMAVSREEYRNLFEVIGTTFGAGDGSTTFNIPNLTSRFIEGADSESVGFTLGTYIEPGLPDFGGNVSTQSAASGGTTNFLSIGGAKQQAYGSTRSGSGTVYATVNFSAASSSDTNAAAVFGKSTTVQPAATGIDFIIKY